MLHFLAIAIRLLRAGNPRQLAALLLWRSGLSSRLTIPQAGFRLRFFPTALSMALWLDPHDRQGDTQFLQTYLQPGDRVIDVGANIGSTALAASVAVGRGGEVFAFEPHPRTFGFLRRNIALNRAQNIRALNIALSNTAGTLRFSDLRADDQNRIVAQDTTENSIAVPVKTLDEWYSEIIGEGVGAAVGFALLKIDVEGHEPNVLRGAKSLLEMVDCIYCEADESLLAAQGSTSGELWSLLHRAGFEIFLLHDRQLQPVAPNFVAHCSSNLIAVRDRTSFLSRTGYELCAQVR